MIKAPFRLLPFAACGVFAFATGCKDAAPPAAGPASAAPSAAPAAASPATADRPAFFASFAPLPDPEPLDNEERVRLGKMLYFEKRVSKSHQLSCNSCHDLARFGVDNEPTSPGHKGQRGGRNSPTTLNAALHVAQFWDGRAKDVEEQAKGPVLNPIEMAMTDDKAVVATLRSIPDYVALFQKAFPGEDDPLTYDNFGRAVGAFERRLVTPSRFDRYLKGETSSLSAEELAGAQKFAETGCTACHAGPALGGSSFMKVGLLRAWEGLKDVGRFEVTKEEADRFVFKVPSLRNVEKTAPYFHDGSEPTLEGAVKKMAAWQLGKDLSDEDASSITTFLKTLTGELPQDLAAAPELPPSTDKTPKPALD
jgi:cytochrome c peroxidase